ncbi:uncharacterized protein LOC110983518 isoform X2 [Acanthaster planci]|uniref:Uncharacterized protein LOC110983518 isoform X2 n=1 Tax=Acanthaster planci TaxID=133434 RepID=A0A8B7Z0N5_ACAPL|nr:uncharacterized protein LOC110983518 isoform X2 [Acanthaster planci]
MAETSWNAKSKRAPMKSVTDPSQLQFTPQRSKFGATQAGQTRLPAGAISEEDTPSPLEIGEIRSRAAQLKERIWRLRLPSRHSTGQETAQWEEQKDLIVHKQELDEKRLLLISEQKNKIDGTVLDVKMRALWSENRLVALKRELLREENLLSISEEKGPISPKDRSKSDDIRSEIANALTNLIKIQDDLLYYQPVFWKYRFQHHSQSYLFHEVLVYAESILFILESQVGLQKGKEANKSTDEQSRINSLRRVADAQQELLNMQKMTYQEMIGTTQEKETHSQGESEEEKTELLQGMSVIRQEKGTPGQAESVKEIKQTEDASKQLELILEQTQVAAEIKREDHHVTVEEIHSHFSAMFETTLDALLLLTSSSTLTLEHLMEGFSDFFWVIGCIDGISDNSHGGWHVTQLGRALSHTNQRIVREIKKTAVAGELSPIFDVKELRFPEQKIKQKLNCARLPKVKWGQTAPSTSRSIAQPTESLSYAPFCIQSDGVPLRKSTDHEKLLSQIASELGEEWERLATTLGVSSSKIFQLKENNRGSIGNAMFQMLLWWHQGGGQLADLVSTLDDVGRNDLATDLQDMINRNLALQSTRSSHRPRHTQNAYKQGFTEGKERRGVSHKLERASCHVC